MTAVKQTAAEKKAAAAAAKAAEAELKAQAEAQAKSEAQAQAQAQTGSTDESSDTDTVGENPSTDENTGDADTVGENPLKGENTGDADAGKSDQAEETLALGPLQLRIKNNGKRGHCRVSKQVIESGETVTIDYANTQLKQLAKGNFAQLNAFAGRHKRFIVEG